MSSVELPELLHRFKAHYPHVTYRIQQNESSRLCELVKSRMLELAIIRLPLELDAFSVIHLDTEPFYFLASMEKPGIGPEIGLSDLREEPLMLPSTEGLGVNYNIHMSFTVAECSDIPLLLKLVSSGFGTAIVPETVARQLEGRNIRASKITDPRLSAASGLIWLKGHHLSATAQHFIEMMRERHTH